MAGLSAALMNLAAFLIAAMWVTVGWAQDLPDPVSDADYGVVDITEARLGQLLFYDKILSGNRNIACSTCHLSRFGTGDGVSLALGEGGIGLGPDRRVDPENVPEERIPRNAPGLWNLGAREFTVLFHDGRIAADATRPGGIRTPLDEDMTLGFSGVLSAQTMFPVLSGDEMAGHYSENDVSRAVRQGRLTGPGGAWDIIADRVAEVPEYAALFDAAYPGLDAIKFTDISNAIAAFMAFEWRSDDSLFDAHLRGGVLDDASARGMAVFYGAGGCSGCHAGPFQTDHGFHAMGVPQFGPGKVARFESNARDEGRMEVTGRAEDAYRFRTPSLRNVTLTGPYGHDGAYPELRGFLEAHVDPVAALTDYDRGLAGLPELEGAEDWQVLDDPGEMAAIGAAVDAGVVVLGSNEIDDLLAFLDSLTGAGALLGRLGVPVAVPSGLAVDR